MVNIFLEQTILKLKYFNNNVPMYNIEYMKKYKKYLIDGILAANKINDLELKKELEESLILLDIIK